MDIQSFHDVANQLVEMVRDSPPWVAALVLFFSACIEYVFPPFPGDTVIVAGGFFAARGAIPLPLALIALISGSMAGSILGWGIGQLALKYKYSRRLVDWIIKPKNLERLQVLYKRYGLWILLLNRFLPGVRGAFMIAAGLARLPLGKILLWGSISSLLWNSLLIFVGMVFSENLESLLGLFNSYTQIMFFLLGLLALIWFVRWLYKKTTNNRGLE